MPSLAPGDALEYRMITKVVKALAPNQFWFEYDFDHDNIILNEVLEIDVPRGSPGQVEDHIGIQARRFTTTRRSRRSTAGRAQT